MPYMAIEHHGARDGVTGSCHRLRIDEASSVLVDCGLFQGEDADDRPVQQIDFEVESVLALLVTHVHIDHVGRIPGLLAAGFQGPIICSQPSAHLLPLVLEDAFRLGISRDSRDIERYLSLLAKRTVALPYNRWFSLIDRPECNLKVRLQRAGHILGSAYVELDLNNRGRHKRILFSGDLGAKNTPLLPPPKPPEKADVLILESTYGDRLHEDRTTRTRRLRQAIERALRNRGTILIPAFSIGRTQELLYELEEILHDVLHSEKPSIQHPDNMPVILDSPLASRFTRAYRELKAFWDDEAQERLSHNRRPLAFEQLLTVDSHADHLRMVRHLASSGRPAIVIAGSGMCNAGRIVNYLKAMLPDSRHDVLFVGYQAKGTPGYDIQQQSPKGGHVRLDNESIRIRASVETIGGYSAHADQQDLVDFVTGMEQPPGEIRLVHGDRAAKRALMAALKRCIATETELVL